MEFRKNVIHGYTLNMFPNIPFKFEKKKPNWLEYSGLVYMYSIWKKILSIILSDNGPIEKIWLYDKRYV